MNHLERIKYPKKPLLSMTLASGHKIRAMSLRIGHTYEGQLEGLPNSRTNKLLLEEQLPQTVKTTFGDWPLVILPPDIEHLQKQRLYSDDPDRKPEFMPPIEMAAIFECCQSKNPDMCASALVIAWYQHACPPIMSRDIKEMVKQISWHKHARDFDY